jgi:hypothetical protein
MLITMGPWYLTALPPKATFLYTGCHSKPCLFYRKNAVFVLTSLESLVMLLRNFKNHCQPLTINNRQLRTMAFWAKWMPWIFPLLEPLITFLIVTLSFANIFLLWFPEALGIHSGHYP